MPFYRKLGSLPRKRHIEHHAYGAIARFGNDPLKRPETLRLIKRRIHDVLPRNRVGIERRVIQPVSVGAQIDGPKRFNAGAAVFVGNLEEHFDVTI